MTAPGRYLRPALDVVILVLLAVVSSRFYVRLDLTEDRVYTIAAVSRELLRDLPDRASITYYLSERLEAYVQTREITDLLSEYAQAAGVSVEMTVVRPESLADTAALEASGVLARSLEVSDRGEQTIATVYSGIVVRYLDREHVIPFIFSSSTLEYELTQAIGALVRDRRPVAGLLPGALPSTPGSSLDDYRYLLALLGASYEARLFAPGEPIPDLDVLLVLSAHQLGARAVEQVSDYLERGNSALFTLDHVEVDVEAELETWEARTGGVRPLLASRGIVVGDGILLDESHNRIIVEEQGEFTLRQAYAYPPWPVVLDQYTSDLHPATARFPGLELFWPTWLEATEPASIIAASTPQAWVMRVPYALEPRDEGGQRRDSGVRGQYGVVAVAEADESGRIAVVADADFLQDRFLEATGSLVNVEFALNLLQWLSSDEELLEIRTRGTRTLRLSRLAGPERQAVLRLSQVVNVGLVPALVGLFGLIRLRRRVRRGAAGTGDRG